MRLNTMMMKFQPSALASCSFPYRCSLCLQLPCISLHSPRRHFVLQCPSLNSSTLKNFRMIRSLAQNKIQPHCKKELKGLKSFQVPVGENTPRSHTQLAYMLKGTRHNRIPFTKSSLQQLIALIQAKSPLNKNINCIQLPLGRYSLFKSTARRPCHISVRTAVKSQLY